MLYRQLFCRRHVVLAALLLLAAPVRAQPPGAGAVLRIRGTVQDVSADAATIVQRDGRAVRIALPAGWAVMAVLPSDLAAIKPGSFVGTAASGPDTHLVAREVVVFPPAMKGAGEGHYAWDLGPESTMTNATVDAETVANDGRSLSLSYKGGTVSVLVPPGAPVVTLQPGERSLLAPGAHAFVVASTQGGEPTARLIAVGVNGLTPPM